MPVAKRETFFKQKRTGRNCGSHNTFCVSHKNQSVLDFLACVFRGKIFIVKGLTLPLSLLEHKIRGEEKRTRQSPRCGKEEKAAAPLYLFYDTPSKKYQHL
jgi:hypothetical protein